MTAHTSRGALDDHHQGRASRRRMRGRLSRASILAILALWAGAIGAQETSFTYQGQLTDAGTPANGDYDLQFALFDADQDGTQIGTTQTLSGVAVSNGLFTVDLNFGVSAFPGANRFLEIGVQPAGGGSFTTLTPRQFISATPYAIRSLNAGSADLLSSTCTGCVQDTQIQSVAGSKVSGTIPVASVPAGSGDYIQNRTTEQPNANVNISGNARIGGDLEVDGALDINLSGLVIENRTTQQPNANFDISGSGTAAGTLSGNVVNATTQYMIGGSRVLSNAGQENLFAGAQAGTNGARNAFFGREAGSANASGTNNVFVGFQAGEANTMGGYNTFVGSRTGASNTTGTSNTFVGDGAGGGNAAGKSNSFFGEAAGAGTSGNQNSFFGAQTGFSNPAGSQNTLIGFGATTAGPTPLTNATAIGANATVAQSNSLVLGGSLIKTNVGIGTSTPLHQLQIGGGFDGHLGFDGSDGSPNAGYIRFGDNTGWKLYLGRARQSSGGALNTGPTGAIMTLLDTGRVGIGTTVPDQTLSVVGNASKSGGGSWASFSDARLKTIKARFTPGLNAVMQLQPVRYEYRPDNALGLPSGSEYVGFAAQAVRKVVPEAVSVNDQGYLMVNNDPILWTMLNAIKEQQQEIAQLRGELRQLRAAGMGGSRVERTTALASGD
jgi:endosialidase-like protein